MDIQPVSFKRKFVIGDIRGALGNLKRLLDQIQPNPEDHLVFLGGNLGPGEDSKGVTDELLRLRRTCTCVFLKGCTEFLFEQMAWDIPELRKAWDVFGGLKILESYVSRDKTWVKVDGKAQRLSAVSQFEIPRDHLQFLAGQHLAFEDKDVPILVGHAGLFGWPNPLPENIYFGAKGWRCCDMTWFQKETVYGHISQKKPLLEKGKIGIDLGSGFEGGKLCAFETLSRTFTEVG